jgi:hypothetical protein
MIPRYRFIPLITRLLFGPIVGFLLGFTVLALVSKALQITQLDGPWFERVLAWPLVLISPILGITLSLVPELRRQRSLSHRH